MYAFYKDEAYTSKGIRFRSYTSAVEGLQFNAVLSALLHLEKMQPCYFGCSEGNYPAAWQVPGWSQWNEEAQEEPESL